MHAPGPCARTMAGGMWAFAICVQRVRLDYVHAYTIGSGAQEDMGTIALLAIYIMHYITRYVAVHYMLCNISRNCGEH
jgi:hypothetical protein